MTEPAELGELFHTLNNQLGIILSHSELLEAKDDSQRARATQVVTTTLEALSTVRKIRLALDDTAHPATPWP